MTPRIFLFDDLTPAQRAAYVVWLAHHNLLDNAQSFAWFVEEELMEDAEC